MNLIFKRRVYRGLQLKMEPSSSQNSTSKSYTDVKTLPGDSRPRANKILDEQKSKYAGLAQENGFCSEFFYRLWWLGMGAVHLQKKV
jgi:hypothetical protein